MVASVQFIRLQICSNAPGTGLIVELDVHVNGNPHGFQSPTFASPELALSWASRAWDNIRKGLFPPNIPYHDHPSNKLRPAPPVLRR